MKSDISTPTTTIPFPLSLYSLSMKPLYQRSKLTLQPKIHRLLTNSIRINSNVDLITIRHSCSLTFQREILLGWRASNAGFNKPSKNRLNSLFRETAIHSLKKRIQMKMFHKQKTPHSSHYRSQIAIKSWEQFLKKLG